MPYEPTGDGKLRTSTGVANGWPFKRRSAGPPDNFGLTRGPVPSFEDRSSNLGFEIYCGCYNALFPKGEHGTDGASDFF